MSIQLKTISKQADDRYTVTVEDTLQQIGTDEKSNPVYQSYSVNYNPATGKEHLKANIEELLNRDKSSKAAETLIMQDIKTTIEAIDPELIGTK